MKVGLKMLEINLSIACSILLIISIIIATFFRKEIVANSDDQSYGIFTFVFILFTSGLDIGLIMFPLMEFNRYTQPEYLGISPLSIEVGFWGGMVWLFYFVTTFYFSKIEPEIKFFENKLAKLMLYILILLTCAFTADLFVEFFGFYLPDNMAIQYPLLGDHKFIVLIASFLILMASIMASRIAFIRYLSTLSIILFSALILVGYYLIPDSQQGISFIVLAGKGILGYLTNLSDFVTPMNNYHQFYMFWWFSWALMIGMFVSQFVPKSLTAGNLFILMLIVPTVPLLLWFSVLYSLYLSDLIIPQGYFLAMFIVGLLFLVNSFDSMIRLSQSILISIGIKKYSLVYSTVLLLFCFIGYTGFEHNGGILKIDYTGTLSIFIIYGILLKFIFKSLKLKFEQRKNTEITD